MQPVLKGFADPVLDSQRGFRLILEAMARPGTIVKLPSSAELPDGIDVAAASVLLILCDLETPVWMAPERVTRLGGWLAFHTGAPLAASPESAAFALLWGAADEPKLARFPIGEDRYPDRSATIIVECKALHGGPRVLVAGPGIKTTRPIFPAGLRSGFWRECADNHELFPLGVDIVLAAGDSMMALPRSTAIQDGGG